MKIIIDSPGGVYPVIADSVEEVETELKLLINQFCELKEPPYYFEFRGDKGHRFYDYAYYGEDGNQKPCISPEVVVAEVNDWFDLFRKKVEDFKFEDEE